jgi:hypothetical protein
MQLDLKDEFYRSLYPYIAEEGTLFFDDVPRSHRLDLVSSTPDTSRVTAVAAPALGGIVRALRTPRVRQRPEFVAHRGETSQSVSTAERARRAAAGSSAGPRPPRLTRGVGLLVSEAGSHCCVEPGRRKADACALCRLIADEAINR